MRLARIVTGDEWSGAWDLPINECPVICSWSQSAKIGRLRGPGGKVNLGARYGERQMT